MESFQKSHKPDSVAVVVPAHNEELTIEECIESISSHGLEVEIFVSNNCSSDLTEEVIQAMPVNMNIRKIGTLLDPVSHFVSAGRWALVESNAEYFCFLAADDLFSSDFVSSSVSRLNDSPKYAMTFPSVEWFSGEDLKHRIKASKLGYKFASLRQFKAFLLPNTREVANQVYGVFTRVAFEDLLNELEKNGDSFGFDFFAVVFTLSRHRSRAIPESYIHRTIREGENLLERVNFQRRATSNPILILLDYLKLHLAINNALAKTLSNAKGWPLMSCILITQSGRFFQIFWEIPVHVMRRIR
jgi:glycosyltransferase involved in cell wall biosynthesis